MLTDALKANPAYEAEDISHAQDLINHVINLQGALVITSLVNKEDLFQIATLIKLYKKMGKANILKIVVINFSKEKKYEKAIAKLGIQDLVDTKINIRALRFKVDYWMKALNIQSKKVQVKPEREESKKATTSKAEEDKGPETSIKWVDPIECEDDIWLIKHEEDCKKVLSKWLIQLMGPSPYAGQFVEVEGSANLWKFEFKKEEKENFVQGAGTWFFRGEQRPDFIWKENIWLITGQEFELFYSDPAQSYVRLSLRNKVLEVSKNSEYAKTKEQAIAESFNKEVVFKNKFENLGGTDSVDSKGVDKLKNLEGKGKTEQLKNGQLSGKSKGTDNLSGDHLSGKSNGADVLCSNLLSQALKPGESNIDGEKRGPASEGVRNGSQLGLNNKNVKHETHYKGHNQAEQFEAGELRKNLHGSENQAGSSKNPGQTFVEKSLGHLGGKSSTDRLKNHYSNQGHQTYPEEESANNGYQGNILNFNSKLIEESESAAKDIDPELDQLTANMQIICWLTQGKEKFVTKLDDYFDQTISFVGLRDGIKIDPVQLDLSFTYLGKSSKFSLRGLVVSVEADEEQNNYVTVEMQEDNVKGLDLFKKLVAIRQKSIDVFMKRAKGL